MIAESDARRYKPGQEFYYDFMFAAEVRRSQILDENYQEGELQGLLERKERQLEMLQDELEDHLSVQKQSKQIEFNKGRRWKEDDRSREKRVSVEARIDATKWEISNLEETIKHADEEAEQKDLPKCLPRGPEGVNQVRGSTGTGFLDGQWCEPVEGNIVITDPRSVYRGLAVMEYSEFVVKPWKQACRKHDKKRRKELLESGVKESLLKRRYTLPWPPFPPDCVNHLNGTSNSESKGDKLSRTRK